MANSVQLIELMVLEKLRFVASPADVDSVLPRWRENGISGKIVFEIFKKYDGKLPSAILDTSITRVNQAFRDFYVPGEGMDIANCAFLVHTRRNKGPDADVTGNVFKQLDDSSRCLPILDPYYGMKEEDVELLWNSLPPFRVGEVRGVLNGKKIKCVIISVPITPQALEDCTNATARVNYARSRISEASGLARKMGAEFLGLGETLASLTRHGEVLQEQFHGIKFTTGHAFTTYFMNEWVKFVAEKSEIRLEDSQVTIIGANGSIGSAMTEMLLEQGVGKLRLHDNDNMIGALRKRAEAIIRKHPDLNGKIGVTGGNGNLKEACRGSKIVLVAASAPKPFIKSEHLDPGTFIINDSQPPGITYEEAKKADSTTLWVVGGLPPGLENTFDSGLVGAEWTCLLEVLALHACSLRMTETTGRVNYERMREAGKIAQKLGMGLPAPQSWGKIHIFTS